MDNTYWHKQVADKPLFPDLIWSRPETKQTAGKLLIIGGNIHGFSAVGQAYQAAQKAGIGTVRVIMPDALAKTVSKLMPEALFAPSTPSGSFSQLALASFLEHAAWADGVLVTGDLARNSETAVVLEKFVSQYQRQLTLTKDAVDYFTRSPSNLLTRSDTTIVLTMAQLQQMASTAKFGHALKFDMSLIKLANVLNEFTDQFKLSLVLKHLDMLLVAHQGQVSTTKTELGNEDSWRVPVAARAAVWWLQNPNKTFEALTTSLLEV